MILSFQEKFHSWDFWYDDISFFWHYAGYCKLYGVFFQSCLQTFSTSLGFKDHPWLVNQENYSSGQEERKEANRNLAMSYGARPGWEDNYSSSYPWAQTTTSYLLTYLNLSFFWWALFQVRSSSSQFHLIAGKLRMLLKLVFVHVF